MGNISHTVGGDSNLVSFKSAAKVPITSLKINFEPIQEGEGDPSSENIRPISGWDGMKVFQNGANLLPLTLPSDAFHGTFATGSTAIGSATNGRCWCTYVGKNTELYWQTEQIGTTITFAFSDVYMTGRNDGQIYNALNCRNRAYAVLDSEEHPYLMICISNVNTLTPETGNLDINLSMLSFGDSKKTYEPRRNLDTYSITFPTGAGTVYGGTIDIVKGTLTVTDAMIASYNGENLPSTWISDRDIYNDGGVPTIGAQVVYKLATPIDYTITPSTLETLIDTNNIWSNTNGTTEISYAIHDSALILAARKRIHAAASKIKEANGNIATFSTDLSAPLKECKIYFNPIQTGEGTPSLDNIRPITGWTGINLYKTKKNMFLVSSEKRREWSAAVSDFTEIEGGVHTSATKTCMPAYVMKCKPNTQYTCSFKANKSNSSLIARIWSLKTEYQSISQNYVFLINQANPGTQYSGTFTTQGDTEYIAFGVYQGNNIRDVTITEMQVELGSEATSYEPYAGTTNSITFPTEAGTAYGGYVDIINGKLFLTYKYIRLSADTPCLEFKIGSNGRITMWSEVTGMKKGIFYEDQNVMCDSIIKVNNSADITTSQIGILFGANATNNSIYLYNLNTAYNCTTLEQVTTWLEEHPIYATIPLETPLEYDINPLVVKTTRGKNNIHSNTNGNIEIQYWAH